MPIRLLSPQLVSQIAAGEVIERPASVVKELVENSLDAGARHIRIDVAQGGRDLVRVSDDGTGIPSQEMALALEAHATSKIACSEDLVRIRTMGFRGEAMAAIRSVGRLRLTSRTTGASLVGAQIQAAGATLGPLEPVACAPGTVVEVKDLFFNTPARRRFLRSAPTELSHIQTQVSRIAMAHPDVALTLQHNGRAVLDLPVQSPTQRCLELLGDGLADQMLGVQGPDGGLKIWGLAGPPALSRPSSRYQHLFVNGRPVSDRGISHAIQEAYRGLVPPGRYPVVVLFLTIDPADVDVNVHPAKSQVRFAQGQEVHAAVLSALRHTLRKADLTPGVAVAGPGELSRESSGGPSWSWGGGPAPWSGAVAEKGFDYTQVRSALDAAGSANPAGSAPMALERKQILQAHESYLVTQDPEGILIMDQHALHERAMFEALSLRLKSGGNLESQRLITPETIPVSPQRMAALEEMAGPGGLLERIGIEAAPTGPATIGIRAFSTLLLGRGVAPGEFLAELLDLAADGPLEPSDEAALHKVLDMMSCKSAVKAGDRLSDQELAQLLRDRETLERSSNCPHGRPTTLRITLKELARYFKRT